MTNSGIGVGERAVFCRLDSWDAMICPESNSIDCEMIAGRPDVVRVVAGNSRSEG